MTTLSTEMPPTLYRHARKLEWGLAVLAWEENGRRAYQFEDGALRVFKEGYYSHFEAVDAPADRLAALVSMMGDRAPATTRAAAPDPLAFTLEEQIDYFLATYPGGFEGETWRSAFRHGKSGRQLKRHRDVAVETARGALSQQALDAFVDQRREHDGIEALGSVLRSTDLVPVACVRPLALVRGAVAGALIGRLRDLLWSSEPFPQRFSRWVAAVTEACDRAASWELVTAPLALVHPGDHVCVHPPSFQAQATWMAPQLRFQLPPLAATYSRALAMAQRIRHRMAERTEPGTTAADLLDVHAFIGFSRTSKACDEIIARRTGGVHDFAPDGPGRIPHD